VFHFEDFPTVGEQRIDLAFGVEPESSDSRKCACMDIGDPTILQGFSGLGTSVFIAVSIEKEDAARSKNASHFLDSNALCIMANTNN